MSELSAKHSIDTFRESISKQCKDSAARPQGAFTLSVPTGGGKTFSSLRFALHHADKHNLNRIVYVIPYTSVIEQNAKAIRKALADRHRDLVLEVHSNLTRRKQTFRDKIVAANWDAPILITTMVQFLESLFGSGTRGARRMHQLAKSVIIFDEIQSLPLKCTHLFNQAANFLVGQCSSTVVLCTARQPRLNKVDEKWGRLRLSDNPEINRYTRQDYQQLRRNEIHDATKPGGWGNDEICQLVVEQTAKSGSCLVVTNTKSMARKIFEEVQLNTANSPTEVAHLSTNMCAAHRKAVLHLVKKRLDSKRPVICISTQLIEAGVDISFGSAVRFLAGLASIAQTAGRCNRHEIENRGEVFVLNPAQENLRGLPEIQAAAECTKRLFADFADAPAAFDHDRIGPKAIDWYYENYFFSREKEMRYRVDSSQLGYEDSLVSLLGPNSSAYQRQTQLHPKAPSLCFRQSFMAASRIFDVIDAPTEGVIVPFGRRGKSMLRRMHNEQFQNQPYRLIRDLQEFAVNVFPNDFLTLQKNRAISPVSDQLNIFELDPQFYDAQFGLATT
ncbi:MAG: CRISPR-associated helicase Cas3', partial [Planctomycetota bacterium]